MHGNDHWKICDLFLCFKNCQYQSDLNYLKSINSNNWIRIHIFKKNRMYVVVSIALPFYVFPQCVSNIYIRVKSKVTLVENDFQTIECNLICHKTQFSCYDSYIEYRGTYRFYVSVQAYLLCILHHKLIGGIYL